jgi:hypothetical protein
VRRGPMAMLLVVSVACSVGSAVIRSSGASGTGTRTSYGFPKPFYFTWVSWEQPVSNAGFEWLYFVGNCVAWLALLSVAALLWAVIQAWSHRLTPLAGDEGSS